MPDADANIEPNKTIVKDLEALSELITLSKDVFRQTQTHVQSRTLRFLGVSIVNSSVAVATLCHAGFGADAIKVARSMFETLITFRYLLYHPEEVKDFVDFDAIARYKRLEFYKSQLPDNYQQFSPERIRAIENAYHNVKKRFSDSKGKFRSRWSRLNLEAMARTMDMGSYMIFFTATPRRYIMADPMGVALLIDGDSLEVQPGPSPRHIGLAIRMATWNLYDCVQDYSQFVGVDCGEALKRIGEVLETDVEFGGSFLGSLDDALPLCCRDAQHT